MTAYKATLSDDKELTGQSSDKDYRVGTGYHSSTREQRIKHFFYFLSGGMELAIQVLQISNH